MKRNCEVPPQLLEREWGRGVLQDVAEVLDQVLHKKCKTIDEHQLGRPELANRAL